MSNMQEAVDLVQSKIDPTVDVIIARGETAQRIRQSVSIPLVEITFSFYDILQAVQLAENFRSRYVIIGFPSITKNAMLLKDLLQTDWDIFTVHNEMDLDSLLPTLEENSIRLVIAGAAFESWFINHGINCIQITTGASSVQDSLSDAINTATSFSSLKKELEHLYDILRTSETEVLLFDNHHKLLVSSASDEISGFALDYAETALNNSILYEDTVHYNNHQYVIKRSDWNEGNASYTLFVFNKTKNIVSLPQNGFNLYNKASAMQRFLQHYNAFSYHWKETEFSLPDVARSRSPIMMVGEEGIGKVQLAASIFANQTSDYDSYYVLDTRKLSEDQWNYLLQNDESPFYTPGTTFFFREIQALPAQQLMTLLDVLLNSWRLTNNKFIFSCIEDTTHPKSSEIYEFINTLQCTVLHILPLRDRKEELSVLSSIYLNSYNIEYAKQISGFTPDALECLKQYDWPGNLEQFKRILRQLVQTTDSPYITKNSISSVLDREQKIEPAGNGIISIDKPLADIEHDVINAVLDKYNGNQTKAANHLGISRTTLWKHLQQK